MKSALSFVGLSLLTGVVVACGGTLAEAPKGPPTAGSGEGTKSATVGSLSVRAAEPLLAPVDAASEFGGSAAAEGAPLPAPAPAGAAEALPVPMEEESVASAPTSKRDDSKASGGVAKRAGGGADAAARRPSASKPGGLAHSSRSALVAGGVRAGEWDDNANFREFARYLATKRDALDFPSLQLDSRRFVVVRDSRGRPVPNCNIEAKDHTGHRVHLTTPASGRALLFPRAEGLRGSQLRLSASCQGERATATAELTEADDAVVLTLPTDRALPRQRTVDIVFVLDTTGSMSEEIDALKGTIAEVADSLRRQNAQPRLGLVEYKDITDGYVTRLHQMTTDVDAFEERVGSLYADGGGDTPEHVNAGLKVAVDKIRWNADSVARLAFLIGDAPPQLHYAQDVSYAETAKSASHRGIQIFTIAASGMDDLGQVVWRQIAQYTGGTNMFVLRGGAGPASTGAGDVERSCGGTHQNYSSGNLATLITQKVSTSLRSLDADPLKIAGLGKDENAKPCSERLTLAR